jgi:hypothetical protein
MKFFSATLLALPFALQAQQVQNVKAVQTNEEVIVTYDLTDTKPVYVSLFYSKDGCTTFSPELRQVSGDVKANVKPGVSKKINWNAGKELVVFDGDLVFKVEANSKKANLPKAVVGERFSVELTNVFFEGSGLKIEFIVTNISPEPILNSYFSKGSSSILDDQSTELAITQMKTTNKSSGETIEFVKDTPYKGFLLIGDVRSDMSFVGLVKLSVGNREFYFKNIPISK